MTVPVLVVVGLVVAGALAACARAGRADASPATPATPPAVTVARGSFRGWASLVLRNRAAEITIVPAIGRIMQMALRRGDRARGSLWSHPGLGPALAADENGWINFGGDKAWPAPQSSWEQIVGQAWPPPRIFDASAYTAEVAETGGTVTLRSGVDPAYGVQVRRTIALDPTAPVLTVETSYEKIAGSPIRVGVWTITQLVSPERLFALLPARSAFPGGHTLRLPDRPKELAVDGRLLSLARDPSVKTLIGSDGESLLWVGDGPDLLIETVPGAHLPSDEWPDGTHAQIYTSSDEALPYVELELFAPLRELRIGERASLTVRYTLVARTESDATAEAKRVLRP